MPTCRASPCTPGRTVCPWGWRRCRGNRAAARAYAPLRASPALSAPGRCIPAGRVRPEERVLEEHLADHRLRPRVVAVLALPRLDPRGGDQDVGVEDLPRAGIHVGGTDRVGEGVVGHPA